MTLKDIAKEAGVSVSTVSRVINNKGPHVARPEIQKRIWDIVGRTGYMPNENALNLKRNKKAENAKSGYSIACLFARTPESISDPFFSQLARSVEAAAYKENCHVQYSLTQIDMMQPKTLHALRDSNVKGIVVLGRCAPGLLHYLKRMFKYVSYTGLNSLDEKDDKYDQVICDGKALSKTAVDYLAALGHKNIAYIGETQNEDRFTGYLDALTANGIAFDKTNVADVQLSTKNGYLGAKELLRKALGITAILCANDVTAIGAIGALRDMGVRVPRDISIIGIDDIDLATFMPIKLTSVHIPVEEMGSLATRVLLDRIEGGHKLHMKICLPFYIAERDSCSKPPKNPWKKA